MLGEDKKVVFRTNDQSLVNALKYAWKNKVRVRISYDGEYGKDGKEYDFGYIKRGFGFDGVGSEKKVLFLVPLRKSYNGYQIPDDHITKIETSRVKDRRTLWERT